MPGLALLELARGETQSAVASIRRALGEAGQPFQRPALLAAAVEIHAAAGDVATAWDGADELGRLASGTTSEVLGAMAEHAIGTVLLATGDATDALVRLRAASTVWTRLQMPYEASRTAVLLAQGCLAMDDRSSAQLELDAARETFASLGAQPDLARLDELAAGRTGGAESTTGGLSARELEVLRHVAAGETNPEIADALTISRHTVNRHLENIFAKLGVAGRAAATAYGYEHDLL
jgi:ATP/maltotriose-dependent transcriptional regulator MalT